MVKVKTSIYVEKELWDKLKSNASKKGLEISRILEEIIRDEMVEDFLEEAIRGMNGSESYEIDFEPVEPEGPVSEFIRVMRDERSDSLP